MNDGVGYYFWKQRGSFPGIVIEDFSLPKRLRNRLVLVASKTELSMISCVNWH